MFLLFLCIYIFKMVYNIVLRVYIKSVQYTRTHTHSLFLSLFISISVCLYIFKWSVYVCVYLFMRLCVYVSLQCFNCTIFATSCALLPFNFCVYRLPLFRLWILFVFRWFCLSMLLHHLKVMDLVCVCLVSLNLFAAAIASNNKHGFQLSVGGFFSSLVAFLYRPATVCLCMWMC